MGVGDDFRTFCGSLAVTQRSVISERYELITRRLNLDFYNTDSRVQHSVQVGSYGRGTATAKTSDVDMIFWLPLSQYYRFDAYSGNGQSALLQAVRASVRATYSSTSVGADGQVVSVPFHDGINFEVLPAFENSDRSFTYPDANNSGRWRVTSPRPEIEAMNLMDSLCNGNLKNLCKMARAWKHVWSVPMSGLLIDTLAYQFIKDYEYRERSFLYYDFMSRDFFEFLRSHSPLQTRWLAPGSGQHVYREGNFEYKALQVKNIAAAACAYQADTYGGVARAKWRQIYGTKFPA
ncbi:hypothetical protein SAMN05428982_1775 [Pseudoxanthomonas sp. CF385]|uniref:SMODS domain-containing nucleotidyltransferase n=1 Tax=Pseudoxanthomonas sp. CF385 TaxID=1881042 RepID=UPI0008820790|nr:nucleotidyltransferase [Pseudoxanthomonas sp. CF385]SDQ60414.1 hypothetical protein SAMN05428982_1775 [Pseudoxanthomonas sp. CF385]